MNLNNLKIVKLFCNMGILILLILMVSHNQLTVKAASIPTLKDTKATLYVDYKAYTIKINNLGKTASVTYKSSNTKIATVTKSGKVAPKAAGTVRITVSMIQNGETYKKYLNVTVKNPYINITKTTSKITAKESFQFAAKAYGTDDDIYWTVSDEELAGINTKTGKLVADKAGSVTVTATTGSYKKSVKVTIDKAVISISGSAELVVGCYETYSFPSEYLEFDCKWAISDKDIMDLQSGGSRNLDVFALKPGTVTITIDTVSGHGEKTIQINHMRIVGDSYVTLGEYIQFSTNAGQNINWSIADPSIVELCRGAGDEFGTIRAYGLKGGTTTLYADNYDDKASLTITVGEVKDFTLIGDANLKVKELGNYSVDCPDGSNLIWSVSDKTIASLTYQGNNAVLSALKKGTVLLTAEVGDRVKTIEVTIADAPNMDDSSNNADNSDTVDTPDISDPTNTTDNSDTTDPSDTTNVPGNSSYKKVTKNGIIYELRDTYAYVAGAVEGTDTVNLPSEVEGLPVTIIGKGFGQCDTLKTVTWTGSSITLEPFCFLYNSSLTSVTLNGGSINIGLSAFDHCTSLSTLKFTGEVKKIGIYAFKGCSSLTQLTIPGTETIYEMTSGTYGPFYGCSSLTSLRLESKVILKNSEYQKTFLYSIWNNNDAVSNINELYINIDKVTTEFLLWYLEKLKKLTLVNTRSTCGFLTSNNEMLEEILLPDTLTMISENAFVGTQALKKINIPASVASIGRNAFGSCTNLTTIDVQANTNRIVDVTLAFSDTKYDSIQGCYLNGIVDVLSADEYSALQTALTALAQVRAKDNYSTIKGCHDWIVNHTVYDYENYQNHTVPASSYTAVGLFLSRTAVCQGYANAFKCLMELAGIECYVIPGRVNDLGHAWNIVKLDGAYYHVDCTWDDPAPDSGTIRYNYFLIGDSVMSLDHTWLVSLGYPTCPNSYTVK